MKIRLLSLFFFFTSYLTANADIFVVTNNADSGPGTLREALTLAAANGILVDDYINFNLPGNVESDRTILLQNELPLISSHIILDASTQPGPNLNNSPAKIIIRANRSVYQSSQYNYGCFNILNVSDIQIYGFGFDQFTSLRSRTYPNGQASHSKGIYIVSGTDITIGAPGKGNVFMYNDFGIESSIDQQYQNKNYRIKIQSNWFGLNLDGSDSETHKLWLASIAANDFDFGGPDVTYGNILGGYSVSGLSIGGNNGRVRFNNFGYGSLSIRVVRIALGIINGEFTDNKANRFDMYVGGKNFKILRNREFAIPMQTLSAGIELSYAENIQIGSDNIADVNELLQTGNYSTIKNFGSKNVEIRKNIIHCSPFAYSIRDGVPVSIKVLVNNDTEYSGIATPNSEVYIYNDNTDCASCSPLQFYTKLTADATTGKWAINGDFTDNKFVANTTLINTSSEFTQPQILTGRSGHWYISTNPSCGESNGVLELERPVNLLRIEWYNAKDEKVGEGTKVTNLPPGQYYAKGYNGKCYTLPRYNASLFNVEPHFFTTDLKVKQPGCGQKNGSIKGLFYSLSGGTASSKWVDENNQTVQTANLDLDNIGPGSYTLVVTTQSNCTKSYGPIHLQNTEGPNIDKTAAVFKNANCDKNDGAITGVTATGIGNIQFTWKDEQNTIVAQTADLTNAKAGKYTLEVKDESTCGTINAAFNILSDNTIGIDEQLVSTTKTTCGKSNGSITGIKTIGTGAVKWLNENNEVVGQTIDLTQVPSGKYKLTFSNAYCLKTSSIFTISEATSNQNYSAVKQLKNATCNQNNGSITLTFNQAIPKAFRWVNENNTSVVIGNSNAINNLPAGFYKLYITDENLCESFYDAYEISTITPPVLNEELVIVENDKCGLKTGSINGISVSGGVTPYRYEWRNQGGEIVSRNASLTNTTAGTYSLKVLDNENCTIESSAFTIKTNKSILPDPVVLPVQICAAGSAIIAPSQIQEGKVLLYETLTATQPIASTKDIFKIQTDKTTTYFVSYANGICESNRVPVLVEVTENSLNIPNSFTPNSDGINDTWAISGLTNYPSLVLKIYNRNGQIVFSTRDPGFVFNGTRNNLPLSIGTYYYVLNLRAGCSTISGSLTLMR